MNAADTDLIAMCDEYMTKHAAMIELSSSVLHSDAFFVRITASIIGLQELRDRIAVITPSTFVGWNARFRVCLAVLGDAASDDGDQAFVRAALREFVASVP